MRPSTLPELREITAYDEMELDTLGDRKTALFIIISDTDDTFNFLVSMAYTQLFNLLCEKADDVYGGRLPVHVRCLIDECANIGQIPKLEKLMATIRSREISACLVLASAEPVKGAVQGQLPILLSGTAIAACFLAGRSRQRFKELSDGLGKETIDTLQHGREPRQRGIPQSELSKAGKGAHDRTSLPS